MLCIFDGEFEEEEKKKNLRIRGYERACDIEMTFQKKMWMSVDILFFFF